MYLGRIVEFGASQTLYENPYHPYTEALISAAPAPNPLKRMEIILLEGDVPSPINPPRGCAFHPRCRYQQEICSERFPIHQEVETGHWAACHFPLARSGDSGGALRTG
jgi:oligopeptide/dipeptide ABC transporter ATP-binding protein